jgi:hypothetical protein
MNPRQLRTCVPPSVAEHAAAEVRWERRGPLARLVRLDPPAEPEAGPDDSAELADGRGGVA